MAEELFDVVDENDQVISTLPRSEVHRRLLLHRAIHVFLFRSDGQMLVHQRSAAKEEFPSVWTSSCSGHVSAGESYEASAPRELEEELGLRASLQWLQKFPAQEATSWEFTVLFRTVSDDHITPDPGEMTAIRWMTVPEISEWMKKSPNDYSPAFQVLFRWYCEQFAGPES